ncbi:MAG TPA: hypothetical protein VF749_01645 [Candidatus Acidoferrum sp.]
MEEFFLPAKPAFTRFLMKTKEMLDEPMAKSLIGLASFSICRALFTPKTKSMEFAGLL